MPVSDRRTCAERVAAYRLDAERSGQNAAELTDAELLLSVLDAQIAERTRIQTRYDNLLQQQVRHDRDVYSAAARSAKDDRRAWREIYIHALLQDALRPLSAVLYQVEQLPARPGPAQTERVKQYAREAAEMLRAQPHSPELGVATRWRDEVWRLRDLITRTARAMHAPLDHPGGGRCDCAGCELIRAMDPMPHPDEPATPGAHDRAA